MNVTRPSRRSLLVGAGAATAGFLAGATGPVGTRADAAIPAPDEADTGFCTDMSAHHLQALVLCQRVLGRNTGDAVQAAAAEVLQNQAMEVGQMRAWLTDWGRSTQPPVTVMAWMGMGVLGPGVPLSEMPGYATDAELHELSTLTGTDQGRRWLELMRAHHVGGVHMAEAVIELGRSDKVIRLATQQAATQQFEIDQYDLLLATSYAG